MRNDIQEYILCAANHYVFDKKAGFELVDAKWLRDRGISPYNITEGIVLCGWRHTCIIAQMNSFTGLKQHETTEVQGFLTSKNRFVTREEAMVIAKERGQVTQDHYSKILYSEDLY